MNNSIHHYNAYNNALKTPAQELRNEGTKAEACLWKYVLRRAQMKGYEFKRQRPVLRYIADFMCQPLWLIIELDGGIHKDDLVAAKDAQRQAELEAAGFTVLRFSNDEVLRGIGGVRDKIETWIEWYEETKGKSVIGWATRR